MRSQPPLPKANFGCSFDAHCSTVQANWGHNPNMFRHNPNFFHVNTPMSTKKCKTVCTLRFQNVTTTGEFFIKATPSPSNIAKNIFLHFLPSFYNVIKQTSSKKCKTVYTLRFQNVTTTGEFLIKTTPSPSNIAQTVFDTFYGLVYFSVPLSF